VREPPSVDPAEHHDSLGQSCCQCIAIASTRVLARFIANCSLPQFVFHADPGSRETSAAPAGDIWLQVEPSSACPTPSDMWLQPAPGSVRPNLRSWPRGAQSGRYSNQSESAGGAPPDEPACANIPKQTPVKPPATFGWRFLAYSAWASSSMAGHERRAPRSLLRKGTTKHGRKLGDPERVAAMHAKVQNGRRRR
jgi:hypothetical protein